MIVSGQKMKPDPSSGENIFIPNEGKPDEGTCFIFLPETIVASFLHLMVLFFKVLLNQTP